MDYMCRVRFVELGIHPLLLGVAAPRDGRPEL